MPRVRRAHVAGTWYPADANRLRAEVDRYVEEAALDALPPPRAIVAPHAGLMYSGPVAGFSYRAVRHGRYRAVLLVGPSHFVPFAGVSVWGSGEWETPLGPVQVDERLAAAIHREMPQAIDYPAAHAREHSLEMQLPFLGRLLPGIPIVPIVIGSQTRDTADALAKAIDRAVNIWRVEVPPSGGDSVWQTDEASASSRGGRVEAYQAADLLLVASSDLSHYEDARTAAAMDAVVLEHVGALDDEALMSALEREPRHACGGGPIVSVLRAARRMGARHARVLEYADSGDVSGDKSSVVGYMSAAIW